MGYTVEMVVISAVVSLLAAAVTAIITNLNKRIRKVEENYSNKQDIRQLVEDKVGGIHEDLREIKSSIDKLFDLYIENKLK